MILLLSTACDSPTRTSEANQILQKLLNVPEFTGPLQTIENSSNPGFVLTQERVENMVGALHRYRSDIEPFLEDGIEPIKENQTYQWARPDPDREDVEYILTVTNGDTLEIRVEYKGWWYEGYYYEGIVIPRQKFGMVTAVNEMWGMLWQETSIGNEFFLHGFIDSIWHGNSYSLVDSLSGGGSYEHYDGVSYPFKAQWDAHGHGSWDSFEHGTGEW